MSEPTYRPGCSCKTCTEYREALLREREVIVMGRVATTPVRQPAEPKRAA
jgi:hypothetical protein